MKWVAAAALLVFAGQAAAAPPQRIMSLKVCTDELLLDLVPASRIASITFLSREKAVAESLAARRGHSCQSRHGGGNPFHQPDLILTDPFMAPGLAAPAGQERARRSWKCRRRRILTQIRDAVRLVAKAVGEEARGEALIAGMDADTARSGGASAGKGADRGRTGARAAYVPGKGGLFDAMLTAAGGAQCRAQRLAITMWRA